MEREKQEAWELAKQLVQIDSSDPGAYEEEIGLWITDWFKKQITDFGGKLADQWVSWLTTVEKPVMPPKAKWFGNLKK